MDNQISRWLSLTNGHTLTNQSRHAATVKKLRKILDQVATLENMEPKSYIVMLSVAQSYAKLDQAVKAMQMISYYKHTLPHFGLEVDHHECYKIESWAKPILVRDFVKNCQKNLYNKGHLSSEDLFEFILKFRCDMIGAVLGSLRQEELYGRISPSKCHNVWNDWIHAEEKSESSIEKGVYLKMRQIYELLKMPETTATDITFRLEPIIKNLPDNNDLIKISSNVFQATLQMAIGNLDRAVTFLDIASTRITNLKGLANEIVIYISLGIKVRRLLITVFKGDVVNGIKSLSSICEMFPYCGDSLSWFTRLTLCYNVDKDVIANLSRFTAPNTFDSEIHQLPVSVYYAMLYKVSGKLTQNDNNNLVNISSAESCITAEELFWLISAKHSIRNSNIKATQKEENMMKQHINGGNDLLEFVSDFEQRNASALQLKDTPQNVGSTFLIEPRILYKAISIQSFINSIRNQLYIGQLDEAQVQLDLMRCDVSYWPVLLVQQFCGQIEDLESDLLSHQLRLIYPVDDDM